MQIGYRPMHTQIRPQQVWVELANALAVSEREEVIQIWYETRTDLTTVK